MTESRNTKDVFLHLKIKSSIIKTELIRNRKLKLKALEIWILKNRERIKTAIYLDFKKPKTEIDTTEIYPVLGEIRLALENLSRWVKSIKVDATLTYIGTRSEILFEPKGTCLIISPWNFPFNLAIGPLVSCIAAGNTAIVKPSELTPNTSLLIKEMVAELFEDDYVTVVEGNAEVTTELLALPFDHVFFTGSPQVGKVVMRAAAENLSSITLELGGKSPAIIDSTANSKDAAKRIAFGKFFNNGQTCIAPDYLLVEEGIKDQFIFDLKEAVDKLFGKDKHTSVDYARIVNNKHFTRIKLLFDEAVENGAKIEYGGEFKSEENFISPVILSNVSPQSKIMEEEIFGPLLPIITFKNNSEVVQLINSKPKPLALYIFSNDKAFRSTVLNQTSAGGVCINECVMQFTHPNLPFGGVNNSGIGKSHGHAGFLAFSNEKPVLRQKRGFTVSYLLYPPYTKGMRRIVDLMLKWF
jgi:aldehyde dehydrogenase (NAD+)